MAWGPSEIDHAIWETAVTGGNDLLYASSDPETSLDPEGCDPELTLIGTVQGSPMTSVDDDGLFVQPIVALRSSAPGVLPAFLGRNDAPDGRR